MVPPLGAFNILLQECFICEKYVHWWFDLQVHLRKCYGLLLQVNPVPSGVLYDKEFIVCSLDLLSGLAEGLGSGIESLVFFFLQVSLSRINMG